MALIGIDLGTTNSLACIYKNGRAELIPNELGRYATKSCVSILEDDTIVVGAAARERLISHPKRTAASFKTWMGTERTFTLGGRDFLPHELSALVLKKIVHSAESYLGEAVEEAIISVPAYFNDNQRCATKLAAQLAGLPVKRLINEPSAAALYYSCQSGKSECKLMVIDFGGGTLDVSVVDCFENMIEIIAIAGNNRLGGDDIDKSIIDYFCSENGLVFEELNNEYKARLFTMAEAAKIKLSKEPDQELLPTLSTQDDIYKIKLNKEILSNLCRPVFEKVRTVISRAVKDSGIPVADLDDVVLVGGSSRLSVFGDYLEKLFSKRPTLAANPESIIALGTGLCAGIKARNQELKDIVMTDVCPFSLGIAAYNHQQDKNPHMEILIQRSSMLPAKHSGTFYTLFHDQRRIKLEIYQGEHYYASGNLKLGELSVSVPPDLAGNQSVQVTFAYDINGILEVHALGSGGDQKSRIIMNPRLKLSEEETAQIVEGFQELELDTQISDMDRLYLAQAERLFTELVGDARAEAAYLIDSFTSAICSGSPIRIRKGRRIMQEKLNGLKRLLDSDFWDGEEKETEL